MKTKQFIRLFTGAICLTVLFACSKNNGKTSNSSSTATDLQTQADDQAQVSNESDAIVQAKFINQFGASTVASLANDGQMNIALRA